jgi:hypothetical protein
MVVEEIKLQKKKGGLGWQDLLYKFKKFNLDVNFGLLK